MVIYFEELLDEAILPGPAPDDSIVRVGQQEAYGHDRQVVLHIHGRPAQVAPVDLLVFEPCQLGHAGAADVHIQQSYL